MRLSGSAGIPGYGVLRQGRPWQGQLFPMHPPAKSDAPKWWQFKPIELSRSGKTLVVIACLIIMLFLSVPIGKITHGKAGGIFIDGDSMFDSVPFGSVVFCLPLPCPDGCTVMARTSEGLVVKRLSNGYLVSENPFGMRFEPGSFKVVSRAILIINCPLYQPKGSMAEQRKTANANLKAQASAEESTIRLADKARMRKGAPNELDMRVMSISALGTMDPALAVDGNQQTFWAPATAGDSYWQIKLDKARKVRVDFTSSSGVGNNVKASLDGKSWHSVKVSGGFVSTNLKYLRVWGEQDGDMRLNLPLNIAEVKVVIDD